MKPNITPSWDLVKPNFELVRRYYMELIYLVLLPSLVALLGSLTLDPNLGNDHALDHALGRSFLGLGLMVVGVIWSLVNLGPVVYLALRATERAHITVGECYRQGLRFIWRLLGLYILFGLMVIGGLILLIVPGFIVYRRYILSSYYLVDGNLGIREAMRRSAADSSPYSGAIWGIIGVELCFTIVGGILSGIPIAGLLLSPLVTCAASFLFVLRYRDIRAAAAVTKTTAKKA